MKTASLPRKNTFETSGNFVPCDRCGARSQTQFMLEAGSLYLCGHHANQHDKKLKEIAIGVYDRRGLYGRAS